MSAVVAVVVVAGARGEIVDISSEIRSEVRAFVSGAFNSSDLAIEEFGDTGLDLPIHTVARLETRDASGIINAQAVAVTDFHDAAEIGQANPGEFGLEADCFSSDEVTHYEVTATAVERREVMFSGLDLLNPRAGLQTVSSSVFISGAIFVWAERPGQDLTGLEAELTVEVRRRGSDAQAIEVFNERITVRGGEGGVVQVESPGNLEVLVFDLAELPGPINGALPGVAPGFRDFESAQVIIIPNQRRDYRYQAIPNQPLTLEATFTIRVANVPGGTGVAAVFGRSFEVLGDLIDGNVPSTEGLGVQARINRAIRSTELSVGSPLGFPILPNACGLFGVESLGVMAMASLLVLVSAGGGRSLTTR